jgi:uncharacterized membrane protein
VLEEWETVLFCGVGFCSFFLPCLLLAFAVISALQIAAQKSNKRDAQFKASLEKNLCYIAALKHLA